MAPKRRRDSSAQSRSLAAHLKPPVGLEPISSSSSPVDWIQPLEGVARTSRAQQVANCVEPVRPLVQAELAKRTCNLQVATLSFTSTSTPTARLPAQKEINSFALLLPPLVIVGHSPLAPISSPLVPPLPLRRHGSEHGRPREFSARWGEPFDGHCKTKLRSSLSATALSGQTGATLFDFHFIARPNQAQPPTKSLPVEPQQREANNNNSTVNQTEPIVSNLH